MSEMPPRFTKHGVRIGKENGLIIGWSMFSVIVGVLGMLGAIAMISLGFI